MGAVRNGKCTVRVITFSSSVPGEGWLLPCIARSSSQWQTRSQGGRVMASAWSSLTYLHISLVDRTSFYYAKAG